ncbi:NADP-dependent oxidoreductase [Hypericibacter adhaerens]|jgi:NADPH-dependent curcumin reductase CurA|uniref:NADP-dependent oxidoreductase n=1 Tax=Hypericibacter adhaerens TaxID=2602016 RepID=A0A5J6N1G1_9PROT|nr:NADP-dependent oxidoreductase [Hypericibacter adhaerens]QEX23679.1 NADP-dependent oxidoreductase [Hypericibacter adhaerens]
MASGPRLPTTSREIRLKRYPKGMPTHDDFELAEVALPPLADGQMTVRNIVMSVDPYMRGRMTGARDSYVAPFELGQPLLGHAVGQVMASRDGAYPVGAYVSSMLGWREAFVAAGDQLSPVDPKVAPLSAYLGVLGMPGLTAYGGLLRYGQPKRGQTLFVSGAAGAVGSVVGQVAKIKGCRVIGSAGGPEKVKWLTEVAGFDHVIDYKAVGDLTAEVKRLAPDGIDIYFENVGGAHLEAALENMKLHGRIIICGMIAGYNERMPGPSNLMRIVRRRLTVQGILVLDLQDMGPDFELDMPRWIAEGRVKWQETVFEGIEKAPDAFLGLFSGRNHGKMVVRLGPDK